VAQVVEERHLHAGVSIKDASVLEDIFSKYNAAYPLGDYLTLMNDSISVVNIGDFDTPIDSSSVMNQYRSAKAIQNGIFYKTVMAATKSVRPGQEALGHYQAEFVRDHDIQFLIMSAKSVLSQTLVPIADTVLVDARSGERFVILK
jgi:hypothetical protein